MYTYVFIYIYIYKYMYLHIQFDFLTHSLTRSLILAFAHSLTLSNTIWRTQVPNLRPLELVSCVRD